MPFFVRKAPKEHGAKLAIEGLAKGESLAGKRVVVVEDVTTTGGSAMKAVDALRQTGAEVALVLTMVDREEGADVTFKEAGLPFRSLYKCGRNFWGGGGALFRGPRATLKGEEKKKKNKKKKKKKKKNKNKKKKKFKKKKKKKK